MTEGITHPLIQDSIFQYEVHQDHMMKKCAASISSESSSSIGEESRGSSSMSSSDTTDDASSSSNPYDLSEIMSQLPIKRGLSEFYTGKSESFTSLARVATIEDLAKKNTRNNNNSLKSSKSCGTGLGSCYKPYSLIPKAIIAKKTIRGSCLRTSIPSKRGTFMMSSKPPLSPLHKNLQCYGE